MGIPWSVVEQRFIVPSPRMARVKIPWPQHEDFVSGAQELRR
jgi:hypothetical protein